MTCAQSSWSESSPRSSGMLSHSWGGYQQDKDFDSKAQCNSENPNRVAPSTRGHRVKCGGVESEIIGGKLGKGVNSQECGKSFTGLNQLQVVSLRHLHPEFVV